MNAAVSDVICGTRGGGCDNDGLAVEVWLGKTVRPLIRYCNGFDAATLCTGSVVCGVARDTGAVDAVGFGAMAARLCSLVLIVLLLVMLANF